MDDCSVDEIADGVYRISTYLPDVVLSCGLSINQFLIVADEPLLFHTGLRSRFPDTIAAVARVVPPQQLRWLSFGHVEADECGAMNRYLAAAAQLQVAFGALGCRVSLDDLCDRPPRALAPGEAIDLGGRRVVVVPTPHAPHNAEAQVLYEETTRTLLCGDLFTQLGPGPAVTTGDLVEAALHAEDLVHAAPPGGAVPQALDHLATFEPRTLAVMHGSSFEGDGGMALRDLARAWSLQPLPSAERLGRTSSPGE